MADTLIERVTGHTTADAVPVEINLIMTDRTLLGQPVSASRAEDASADPELGEPAADIDAAMNSNAIDGADGVDEPGWLLGYGPIPAGLARELAYGTYGTWPDTSQANTDEHSDLGGRLGDHAEVADRAQRWIRRLYLQPDTGQLAAMDSRRRDFPPGMQHYLRLRDRLCRTPYCGAPIRHADHIHPHARGGPTRIDNARGFCEA